MKLDKILALLMLLSILGVSFAEIPPEAFPITYTASKIGIQRACVIAATVKEDWDQGTTEFPMPDWLTDNLIMPLEQPLSNMDLPQWQYSITNYYNTVSMGAYNVVGKVNENNGGEYFVGDQYYASQYTTVKSFEEDILAKADAVIDFADYDGDGNGVVDLCYIVLPRVPKEWPDGKEMKGWTFGFPFSGGYPTQDDAVCGGKVKISGSNTFEVGSTQQACFNLGSLEDISTHEHGHLLSLDDWYDNGGFSGYAENFHNLYAASAVLGMYSRMQTGTPSTKPMPYSSAELVTELGWGDVDTIWENDQSQVIGDYLETGDIIVIPVSTGQHEPALEGQPFDEYFVLSAHLKSHPTRSYWEGETEGTGMLIWHVYKSWEAGWGGPNFSELKKRYDLECAGGKWDLEGYKGAVDPTAPGAQPCHPDDPRPEFGWDRLELNGNWLPAQVWSDSFGGTWSNEDDYFYDGWRTAMHTLTNPSSDAYNFEAWENFIYPAGEWSNVHWKAKDNSDAGDPNDDIEGGYRQNIATHISFEGINQINEHEMELCIRRSRIWSDIALVTDRTSQRKFLYDGEYYHFIYPSKGYIYYTTSDDPSRRWFTGTILGNGTQPALALNRNSGVNRPIAVWNDDGDVMFSYFDGSQWSTPVDLNLPGVPGPVAIDYYYGTVNQQVHIAYITRDAGVDKVQHAYFGAGNPSGRVIETVDNLTANDQIMNGVSIVVNQDNHDVHIAYGGYKSAACLSLYAKKTGSTWGIPQNLDVPYPQTHLAPFLDREGNDLRVVYNNNMSIWLRTKPITGSTWGAKQQVDINCGGGNYAPQIAGSVVTWTRLGDDINVYGRDLYQGFGEFLVPSPSYGGHFPAT